MSPRPLIPRELVTAPRRRRIIDAVAELSAARGYERMTIDAVVRRADVARKTLYDDFGGKEEVFLAALEEALREAGERVERAFAAAGEDWRERVRAALAALLAFLAERPAQAGVALIAAPAATSASAARYEQAIAAAAEALRRVTPEGENLPETIEESVVGGVAWTLTRQVRRDETERASELLPELAAFVLAPWR